MASPNVDPTEDPNQNLKIMVLGKAGSGKSTLINSVFGKRVATTRGGFQQQGHETVEVHSTEINGVHLTFYDTRGIGISPDETQKVLDDIMEEFSSLDIDLFLICIRLTERLTQETLDTIRDIQEIYGNIFLQRGIVVCTFTNVLEDDVKRDKPNINKEGLMKKIQKEVKFVSNKIQDTWRDVPAEVYSEIPFITVGLRNTKDSRRRKEELKLSTSDNWIYDFFDACSKRCPERHLEPLRIFAKECVPCVNYPSVIAGAIGMILFPGAAFVIGSALARAVLH